MNLDHVAIAVRSLDEAVPRLEETLGYRVKTERVVNTRHKVTVQFLSKTGSLDMKLIEPYGEDSPLWEFVKKGEGLHHLCFKVEDIKEGCRDMVSKGVRVVSRPAPGEAFDDHPIAFCYLGLGLNIELIDTDARRALVES
jgi:methylmalonyl-CoA/ethylmalonyl-CoA epimerase